MIGLRVTSYKLGTRCNEVRNSESWEWQDKELKKLGMTQEQEDNDLNQGDKMGRNENTRLMCQWLLLNPLRGMKEVTSIYTCLWALHVVPCLSPRTLPSVLNSGTPTSPHAPSTHSWSYRQGRSMRLIRSSTPACVDENSNICSYGKVTPFQTLHGNQVHIYKMLHRPFKLFINGTLKNRPWVLEGNLRGRIMSWTYATLEGRDWT